MKKPFLVLFLVVSIIPSVALASWWNPFSWFNKWTFNEETLPSIQVEETSAEEKIIELQKQIDDLKKNQVSQEVATAPKTKEGKKDIPVV